MPPQSVLNLGGGMEFIMANIRINRFGCDRRCTDCCHNRYCKNALRTLPPDFYSSQEPLIPHGESFASPAQAAAQSVAPQHVALESPSYPQQSEQDYMSQISMQNQHLGGYIPQEYYPLLSRSVQEQPDQAQGGPSL